MTYSAQVKLIYINDTPPQPSKYFPEIVDGHTITIEAPAQDLNVHQYFALFKSFLRAIDFHEYNIMDGACQLAFNDCNDESDMKKLMVEYDLQDKQAYTDDDARDLENEIRNLKAEIVDLKAKLSRCENPDVEQYTDEEIEAMTLETLNEFQNKMKSPTVKWNTEVKFVPSATKEENRYNKWNDLIPGSDAAYAKGCKCPILDNQEMPDERKWVNGDCPLHGKAK